MKKVILVSAIVLSVFISCKKTTTTSTGSTEIAPSSPKEAEIVEPSGNQCFASTVNNSTVELSFNVNSHQEVNGNLRYSLYGKDKNEGTINGNMVGDTLIADYTFNSEGTSSVRQVVFLQNEGTLIEGYGDVVEANGKVSFKDRKTLKFDPEHTLIKVDCDKTINK
jgi:hypothetical protein